MENNTPIEEAGEKQPESAKKPTTGDKAWQTLGEFVRFIAAVVVIVFVVRFFIAQPFIVSGTSMVPTFQNANYLVVDEISYRFHKPERGDVIVFHPPVDIKEYYIKRVIGIPGDTVNVHNGIVTITNADHPQGIVLSEPYITPDTLTEDITMTVPAGQYFVMGDNRPASYDSRKWGLLPYQNITGRAFLRLFPINEIGVLPGKKDIAA